jgi:hypothetical protein
LLSKRQLNTTKYGKDRVQRSLLWRSTNYLYRNFGLYPCQYCLTLINFGKKYVDNVHCGNMKVKLAGIAQSVQRLATDWKVRGSNSSECAIFRTRPDLPWSPGSLIFNGYRLSFQGVKLLGRGVNHPHLSKAEIKERVEQHIYSSSGPSWPVSFLNILYIYQ